MDDLDPDDELERLPDDLYIGLVDGLFQDRKALIMGSAATCAAAVAVAFAVKSPWAWAYMAAMPTMAAYRLRDMSNHAKIGKIRTAAEAAIWERRYVTGASTYMALLSVWTLVIFWNCDDGFVRTLALLATIGHALGIATRNFTILSGTRVQLLAAMIPLALAFGTAGGAYPLLIPLVLAPLTTFVAGSAKRLRHTFVGEMLARRRAVTLAQRFDAALNNMPHGLCMLDPEGRLVVVNDALVRLLGTFGSKLQIGADIKDVLAGLVSAEQISRADGERVRNELFRSEARDAFVGFETVAGKAIEISAKRMENDGAVLVVQDVSAQHDAKMAIEKLAKFDVVTALPNRHQFEERLRDVLSAPGNTGKVAAILFIDLDDFKQVNDTLGHARGDDLLRIVASRLSVFGSIAETVARWGGDEFALFFNNVRGEADICKVATRIIAALSKPCSVDGYETVVGASIGIAFVPIPSLDVDQALRNADLALYAAKREGRNKWRVFQPEMHEKAQLRRLLELDLRMAIARETIEVYFQPLVCTRSERVLSFEALARWKHPTRGFVSPAEFIPLVEELGLIEPFSAIVLKRACAACASWPGAIRVAVNLSPTQFLGGNVGQSVRTALASSGLPPDRLELELTESLLLDNRPSTLVTINGLREMGVRIALDDFGTGFSSLSYLLKFPLDKVKIDKSFTFEIENDSRMRALVDNIARMIRSIGMRVTIEGVETVGQLELIRAIDAIDEMQGYLYSAALAEDAVGPFLLRHTAQIGQPRPQSAKTTERRNLEINVAS